MKILNDITCNLNRFPFQLSLDSNSIEEKFGARGIENMLVIFIIHDYNVDKENSYKKTLFHSINQSRL
jgi:hypothetical protein